jgi:hypothetical protein
MCVFNRLGPFTTPVDSIPRRAFALPDGALAAGVQTSGCEGAGRVYTAVAQDAKMEILTEMKSGARQRCRKLCTRESICQNS